MRTQRRRMSRWLLLLGVILVCSEALHDSESTQDRTLLERDRRRYLKVVEENEAPLDWLDLAEKEEEDSLLQRVLEDTKPNATVPKGDDASPSPAAAKNKETTSPAAARNTEKTPAPVPASAAAKDPTSAPVKGDDDDAPTSAEEDLGPPLYCEKQESCEECQDMAARLKFSGKHGEITCWWNEDDGGCKEISVTEKPSGDMCGTVPEDEDPCKEAETCDACQKLADQLETDGKHADITCWWLDDACETTDIAQKPRHKDMCDAEVTEEGSSPTAVPIAKDKETSAPVKAPTPAPVAAKTTEEPTAKPVEPAEPPTNPPTAMPVETEDHCKIATTCEDCVNAAKELEDASQTCWWTGDECVQEPVHKHPPGELTCETPKPPTKPPVKAPTDKPSDKYDEDEWSFGALLGMVFLFGVVVVIARKGFQMVKSMDGSDRGAGGQYRGVATEESDDEWGWGDDNNSKPTQQMELPSIQKKTPLKKNILPANRKQLKSHNSDLDSDEDVEKGKRPVLPLARRHSRDSTGGSTNGQDLLGMAPPSTAVHYPSPPAAPLPFPKKQPSPKPPEDDIFAQMGFSAKPKFSHTTPPATTRPAQPSSLGAADVSLSTGGDWDDDADLDDLLND